MGLFKSSSSCIKFASINLVKKIQQGVDRLLPSVCLVCRQLARQSLPLCQACARDLPSLTKTCIQCARFLAHSGNAEWRCGQCLNDPPPFEATFALFRYQAPIDRLIIELKFKQKLSHALLFGKLFTAQIREKWYADRSLPDLIIPMPLSQERLRERGFNQSLELIRDTAKNFNLPLDLTGIQRSKATLPQSGLSAQQRQRNLTHAFSVYRDYHGLFIAVVDDVITTGHTIRTCCLALKKHGAAKIDVWCCARNH